MGRDPSDLCCTDHGRDDNGAMRSQYEVAKCRTTADRSGSDKGKMYGGLYEVLLQPTRYAIKSLVEIGIGTLIPNAPSSMVGYASADYRPGGSLRAWRDFLPNAEIHGVDIAPDTELAEELRITTHVCDSTNSQQTELLLKQIQTAPDVIIDDGLHTKQAQIATLRNFFPALRGGGLYVIEDVFPDASQEILENLARFHPSCPFFVDRSCGFVVAIVIRKPETEPSWIIDYSVKQIPKEITVHDIGSFLGTRARAFRGLFWRKQAT
jgi:hypothetical protein